MAKQHDTKQLPLVQLSPAESMMAYQKLIGLINEAKALRAEFEQQRTRYRELIRAKEREAEEIAAMLKEQEVAHKVRLLDAK